MTGGKRRSVLGQQPLFAPTVLVVTSAAAAVVVVLLGVAYAGHTEPGAFDSWVQPVATDSVNSAWAVAIAIDFLGEPRGSALVMAALVIGFVVLRRWRSLALALAGPGLTTLVTSAGKPLSDRIIHTVHLSYPSGHTAFVTAVTLVLVLPVAGRWRNGAVIVLIAALVAGFAAAWAQVGLNAHYATDTVGGFCAAVAIVPVTAVVIDRIADRVKVNG